MAIRYFCDRCGAEVPKEEFRVAELSLPPEPDISLDLCSACAEEVRRHMLGESQQATA
jgi:hypothetical protein